MNKQTIIYSLAVFYLCSMPMGNIALAESPRQANREAISVSTNYRVYPSNTSQTEVFITAHPANPDILFASANTIQFQPFFISEGVYVSTDGGDNWFGSDTCTGNPINFHGGDPGIAIDKDGTFILVRRANQFPGLYGHFSTDNGLSWSSSKAITTDELERATIASDANPASGFYGRTYTAWVRFAPPYPVFFAYTDDGGGDWSAPQQINNPTQRGAGGEVVVDSDGKVHICWAGVAGVSPFTEVLAGYAVSTDGGNSWNVTENAFAMNGIQGILPEKQNIRVNGLPRIAVDNSGGPRNGWVYIVTAQKNLPPAGSDPDIILNRSTDGGQSWSAGIRVNQDVLNNGDIQFFPAIAVDDGGGVNVLYYDDRNTASDSTGVFLSRSTDGGNSWTDTEISDHNFRPQAIGGLGQGYQGDNIDLTAVGNTLWPVWMDNSSGTYQIWTAPVEISTLGIEAPRAGAFAGGFALRQNYPNPFNPATTIEYRLGRGGFVTLKIYDIRGKEIAALVNEKQTAGAHRVRFDAGELTETALPSGVYYYKLSTKGFSQVKKMVLVR